MLEPLALLFKDNRGVLVITLVAEEELGGIELSSMAMTVGGRAVI